MSELMASESMGLPRRLLYDLLGELKRIFEVFVYFKVAESIQSNIR
jgi:hypothetical protein